MQHFESKLVSPPEDQPVSLDDVKAMLKFPTNAPSSEDSLIDIFRLAAISSAENFLNRKLITQTWEMQLDCFPCYEILLPYGELQSVEAISYIDPAGVIQTWDSSLYRVDAVSLRARITPVYGQFFPSTLSVTHAVTVRFVCGYGDQAEDVPQDIRLGILFAARSWYDNRASGDLPKTSESLFWPYRLIEF
jgi:uncharacterized phiE125 gp8 family phage protein